MGIVDDIKSIFRTGSDIGDKFNKFNTRSIARGAMEQSFIFQSLIDEAVPVDMATVISQQLDRTYASWTQIYLSGVGLIDLNYIKNPKQFVAKYQPKGLMLEEADDETETCMRELKDGMFGDDEMFFAEDTDGGKENIIAMIHPTGADAAIRAKVREGQQDPLAIYNKRLVNKGYYAEAPGDDLPDVIVDTLARDVAYRDGQIRNNDLKAVERQQSPRLTDSDVKKINDMQPYTLELKLLVTKDGMHAMNWMNFTVGVKTHMHLANTNKMQECIVDVLRNRDPLFNFVRWTTGEISLVKDILLHVDDINFDIANKSDRTGKFFSSLKELKKKWAKVGLTGVNKIAPFATIVIASSTYHGLKDKYGYDLKNITFAKKVMNQLFLMCFIIVDDATRTYDILVDGQADFQTYSLETLEREVAMKSSKLSKELTRMLGAN